MQLVTQGSTCNGTVAELLLACQYWRNTGQVLVQQHDVRLDSVACLEDILRAQYPTRKMLQQAFIRLQTKRFKFHQIVI